MIEDIDLSYCSCCGDGGRDFNDINTCEQILSARRVAALTSDSLIDWYVLSKFENSYTDQD